MKKIIFLTLLIFSVGFTKEELKILPKERISKIVIIRVQSDDVNDITKIELDEKKEFYIGTVKDKKNNKTFNFKMNARTGKFEIWNEK